MSQPVLIDTEALTKQIDQLGVDCKLEWTAAVVSVKQQAIEALKGAAAESAKRQDAANTEMVSLSSYVYEQNHDQLAAFLLKYYTTADLTVEGAKRMLAEAARTGRWVLVAKLAELLQAIG